jgi:hypothetical protein
MLVGPESSDTLAERKEVQAAAQSLGQELVVVSVSSAQDIEPAFATFVQRGAGAVLIGSGAFRRAFPYARQSWPVA